MRNEEKSAFAGIDTSREDKYNAEDWFEGTASGGLPWTKVAYAAYRRFLHVAGGLTARASQLIPTEAQVIEFSHSTLAASAHTRIAKKGKNFAVYLPAGSFDLNANDWMDSTTMWEITDWDVFLQKMERRLPNLGDVDAPIDIVLPKSILDMGFTYKDLSFETQEEMDAFMKCVRNLRLVMAPCRKKLDSIVNAGIQDAWANGSADSADKRAYVKGLLRARQAVLFFEIEVSYEAAEHICQGTPTLGMLGEYFGRMLHWLYGTETEYVHNIVPISKIAAQNAESGLTPVSRTDENGLAVDSRGNLFWLPTVDNAEFVEAEIEQGGIQPDGDWTRLDAVNPEATEYVVTQGAGGRNVRMRKPKGRNRLIYTDWHNSRLSYTDEDGQMQIMDMSMFRKATAGQIANVLRSRLTDTSSGAKSSASSLAFAIERGVSQMGIQPTYTPDEFNEFFDEHETQELIGYLRAGKFNDFLATATRGIQNIQSGIFRNGRRWSSDELLALDALLGDDFPTLDHFGVNSPLKPFRVVGRMLAAVFAEVMKDPASVFGRHSVTSTLREMSTLLIASTYAGRYQELRTIDERQRQLYLNPDLSPINDIEIKDIPFVSGSVEVFPHQVKAWNWLKNAPENVVLDVAAGGGKTLLALLDMAYHIGRGMRRPLAICPGDLIKNYINDAQWLFKGKMNIVVINGTTFESKEWGEQKLRDLANNAPINTIFITDYDFIIPKSGSKRMVKAMYGVEQIRISLNNEFLKGIEWGGIWMDESHLTKNAYSSTNRELQRLIATIPFKRQLSGTYISDNLTDVVGEFSLIDPQTFGTMDDFVDEYYDGNRKSAPIPGAQRMIRKAMSENANVITIRRKEWAALLPRRQDVFHPVHMSPAQKAVYERILAAQKEELLRQTATDAEIKALLNNGRDENDLPINIDELLDGQLSFVFQRLEQFVTAPSSDELGQALSGNDRKSPKLAKVEEIIRKHLADGVEGKILVWTQYVESAANIYEMLSPDLKAIAIHYKAAIAEQAMAEFESNPKPRIMIGCEKSMNTGHNFQFCSRIIRLETVWNWGTLEQGESRINRPKLDDPRRHENGGHGIFYDWVFCDESIDVTKNSRMISKLISTIKFYEQNNQAYQDLPDIEPIALTQKNIFAVNKWNDPDPEKGCMAYFDAYQTYQQLEQAEFDAYVTDPENRIEPYTLEEGAILEGSGLLKRVPYVPQMKIYGQEQLGLVPFLDYISNEYVDKKRTTLLADSPTWDPAGMKLHTEYGDCICRGYNKGKKSVRVTTPDGSSTSVPVTVAWVITKDVANGSEMRAAIGKRIGAIVTKEVVPVQIKKPNTKDVRIVPTQDAPGGKSNKRAPSDDAVQGAFEINLDTYNEYLSLVVTDDDPDVAANMKTIESLGFIEMPHYYYTRVRNFKVLQNWIARIDKTKLEIHARFRQELEEQIAQWQKYKSMERFAQGLAGGSKKRFLTEQKQPAPKNQIRPYLVTHNDEVFLCLNVAVNRQSFTTVKAANVAGITWKTASGEHWFFARSKQEVQTLLKTMFSKFTITNREDLVADLAKARIVKVS